MFFTGNGLKKVSEDVYYEVDSDKEEIKEDLSSSKKWRRSFQPVFFILKNVEIISQFNVNESDYFTPKDDSDDEPYKSIEPNVSTSTVIRGYADKDDEKEEVNRFYFVDKFEDGYGYPYEIDDPIKVVLKTGEPNKDREGFTDGTYNGQASHVTSDPSGPCMYILLEIPEAQMNDIVKELQRNPDSGLRVGLELHAFANGMEAFFSSSDMPLSLLITRWSGAFASQISVTAPTSKVKYPVRVGDDLTLNNTALDPSVLAIASISKGVNYLVRSIWILIFAIGALVFTLAT